MAGVDLQSLKQRASRLKQFKKLDHADFAPAAVFTEAELPGLDSSTQMMAELLRRTAPVKETPVRGHAKLGALTASGKAGNEVTEFLDSRPELSTYAKTYRTSGVHDEVARAMASGQKASIFAPTNDAHAMIPNLGVTKIPRDTALAKSLASQHVVIDHDKVVAAARMETESSVGAPTLLPGVHVGYQPMEGGGNAAISYGDDGVPVAAARITGTYITKSGHMIHEIDSVLDPSA